MENSKRLQREGGAATLSVNNLGKRFSASEWAVRGLTFDCYPGEVVGLLGENGAGKTTTLRILATTLMPTEGRAIVAGFDVRHRQSDVRRSVGILFGGRSGLYDRLTARENIRYFAELNGISGVEFDRRLEETSEMLEMKPFLDRRASAFSTGMVQKTSIARSIIHNPAVLLLDEPSSGLDVAASRNIYQFIRMYRDLGKTVLFSSHNMEAAGRICDRVIIIHRGEIRMIGTPEELITLSETEKGPEEGPDQGEIQGRKPIGGPFERAFLKLTGGGS